MRTLWRAKRPTTVRGWQALRKLAGGPLQDANTVRALTDAHIDRLTKCTILRPFLGQVRAHYTGGRAAPYRTHRERVADSSTGPPLPPATDPWPAFAKTFLRDVVRDPEDIQHVCKWILTIAQAHMQRNPGRDPNVFLTAFLRESLRLFRLVNRARGTQCFRHFLPLSCTIEQLREAMAKVLIVWARSPDRSKDPTCRATRQTSNILCSQAVRVALVPIRSAIKSGVFHRIAPDRHLFTTTSVYETMRRLAAERPDEWSFEDQPSTGGERTEAQAIASAQATRRPISEEEVQRLITHASAHEGPWMQALLATLVTAAPRIRELAHIRVGQVVDVATGTVHPRFHMVQKANRRRVVMIRQAMAVAIANLVKQLPHPLDPEGFLFRVSTEARRPPSVSALKQRLAALCVKAGVHPVRPHAFRAFVVNYGTRRGASLAQMAAAVGHSNAVTTGKYYWTDDVARQVAGQLEREAGVDADTLRRRLAETQERIAALRTRLSADRKRKREEDGGEAQSHHQPPPSDSHPRSPTRRCVRFAPEADTPSPSPSGLDVDDLFRSLV